MDGTYITAMRTGAAAKYLAKKDAKTLGVIGAGLQGRMSIMAIKEVFDIEKVKVMDIRKEIAQKYAEEMNEEPGLKVQAVKTNMEVVEGSDIVVTVTTADKPLVKKEWLKEGALVISVGSYQELDALIPITTDKLVVDSWVQNTHRGELIKLIKSGKINKKDIYAELGEIVAGKKVGRENNGEMICTCLIGVASLDMGIARFVYNELKSRDDTIKFELI